MNKIIPPLVMTLLALSFPSSAAEKLAYPATRKVDQNDQYHGTPITDPFRWLEDDNSSDTKAWVEAQNKVTFGWLEQISERKAIKALAAEGRHALGDSARFEKIRRKLFELARARETGNPPK